jgi:hypothetical protein
MFSGGRDNNATRMVAMCVRKWRARGTKQFFRKQIRKRGVLSSGCRLRRVGSRRSVNVAFACLSPRLFRLQRYDPGSARLELIQGSRFKRNEKGQHDDGPDPTSLDGARMDGPMRYAVAQSATPRMTARAGGVFGRVCCG